MKRLLWIRCTVKWVESMMMFLQWMLKALPKLLEEASPAKGVLVAPAIAAIVGILGGIFYARRS